MGVYILNHHGRVIDQNTDRQRQTAERHNIDGLASQMQANNCA